jgi:RND superfamily putative drug exporter
MFERLGHFAVRRQKIAVITFIFSILISGVVGTQVFSRLDSGGYSIASSDSYKVYEYIRDTLK